MNKHKRIMYALEVKLIDEKTKTEKMKQDALLRRSSRNEYESKQRGEVLQEALHLAKTLFKENTKKEKAKK